MLNVEKTLEMRGMPRDEIVNYFIGINGKSVDGRIIIGYKWEVEIEREETITLGSIKVPSTKVVLRCEQEYFDQILYAFRLRFLSAGG